MDNSIKLPKDIALKQLRQVRSEFTEFYNKLCESYCTDEVICDLMSRRLYTEDSMYQTLKSVGLIRVDSFMDVVYSPITQGYQTHSLWGLTDNNGVAHLSRRYVVPIRDIAGQVTAIVGWYPDSRKYITTPTFCFARDAQFFNVECFRDNTKDYVFLAEGIFDTLSLRSQGIFALGNMGLYLSALKARQLQRYGKVYAVTDSDKAGQSVLPHNNGKNKWSINNATFVKIQLPDTEFGKVKDIDDAIKFYDITADLQNIATKSGYLTYIREG